MLVAHSRDLANSRRDSGNASYGFRPRNDREEIRINGADIVPVADQVLDPRFLRPQGLQAPGKCSASRVHARLRSRDNRRSRRAPTWRCPDYANRPLTQFSLFLCYVIFSFPYFFVAFPLFGGGVRSRRSLDIELSRLLISLRLEFIQRERRQPNGK